MLLILSITIFIQVIAIVVVGLVEFSPGTSRSLTIQGFLLMVTLVLLVGFLIGRSSCG